MKHKKYLKKFWNLLAKMEEEGIINHANIWSATEDLKIALTKLEDAFEQEIENE
jgi:predicted AlkP superfamily phosphohydrolase/phosphomutase